MPNDPHRARYCVGFTRQASNGFDNESFRVEFTVEEMDELVRRYRNYREQYPALVHRKEGS